MPMFMDWHAAPALPDNLKQMIRTSIDKGEADEWGVVDRGVVYDKESNRMYCLLEAPNEDAVRKHHEAAGVPLEAVHPAEAILKE